MVPPVRTPALLPVPLAPGMGATAGGRQPPDFFPASVQLIPPPSQRAPVHVMIPPGGTRAFLSLPPPPRVVIAVGQPVAAAYPIWNRRAPASAVVPPVRTPALLPVSLAPAMGAAVGSARAVETPPPFFSRVGTANHPHLPNVHRHM